LGTRDFDRRRERKRIAVEAERVNGPSELVRADKVMLHWPRRGKQKPGPQRVKVLNVFCTAGVPLALVGAWGLSISLAVLQQFDRAAFASGTALSLATGIVGGTLALYGATHRPYEVDAPQVETVIR
jgi:hypothetical protein